MQRQTTLGIWCERIIEAGWLLALTLVPIYFNLLSSRHFEPDKATTLRALVLVMLAAAIILGLERFNSASATTTPTESVEPTNPFGALWRRFAAVPLAVPTLVYILVFLLATVTSIVPRVSFWGSFQRMQGTYTNLSYIALFALIVLFLRRRDQLERIITVTLLASLPVSGYGLVQHLQLDPLPWKGDVITRVASTMGNSIFVAAYLIMVVPFALYRIVGTLPALRRAPNDKGGNAWLWALAYVLLAFGTLALLLSTVMFGAVVRVADFRYWWVFPGAIVVCTALWVLPTLRLPSAERIPALVGWTAALTLGYFLLLGFTYAISSGSQVVDTNQTTGAHWGWWMLGSILAFTAFFVMAYTLPRRAGEPSRQSLLASILGSTVVFVAAMVTIFFTQSRGPWIGTGIGLFVFFTLTLWWAVRQARAHEMFALMSRLRIALWSWIVLTVAVGGFLIAFNTLDTPFFDSVRQIPYLGRMGRLLETEDGTGLVRRLIWFGDQYGGGAVGLITADPFRTVVGWGPESMFVAYNPFYPPSLANIESRGASPDRSHQAILDELANKGFLGLLSYLFLLFSFIWLCWRLVRRSDQWHWQIFFIACLSTVVSHFFETMVGIPIVSTLMIFWVTLALTVVGGMLAGVYTLGASTVAQEALPEAIAVPAPSAGGAQGKNRSRNQSGQRQRGAVARGAAVARGGSTRRRQQTNPVALLLYSVLLVITLGAVWWFNFNPVYADMRFQEAQSYSENPSSTLQEQEIGLDKYLDAVRADPDEDFYYLNLGRTLMNVADYRRAQGAPLTPPDGTPKVDDLVRLNDVDEVQQFVQSKTPLTTMAYAEVVLTHAYDLNPLNKDHAANLARLNNFWYNWTQDPARLNKSIQWYEQASKLAPQDVTIANEHASVVALLGNYTANQGDKNAAQGYYSQAEQLLANSKKLDAKYNDTDGRLADVYRLQGRFDEATDLYVKTIAITPHQFDANLERMIADYTSNNKTDLLKRVLAAYNDAAAKNPNDGLLQSVVGLMSVRTGDLQNAVKAYAAAVKISPQRLDYQRNYTIVLSDTRRYPEALAQAQQALQLVQQQAQAQQASQDDVATFQSLVALLQKAAGGK